MKNTTKPENTTDDTIDEPEVTTKKKIISNDDTEDTTSDKTGSAEEEDIDDITTRIPTKPSLNSTASPTTLNLTDVSEATSEEETEVTDAESLNIVDLNSNATTVVCGFVLSPRTANGENVDDTEDECVESTGKHVVINEDYESVTEVLPKDLEEEEEDADYKNKDVMLAMKHRPTTEEFQRLLHGQKNGTSVVTG